MPQRLRLARHLSAEELRARFLECRDVVEKVHWQTLWLVSQGRGSSEIAEVMRFTVHGVRKLVARYREGGPGAMEDGRHSNPGQERFLGPGDEAALREALKDPPPDGGI